MPLSEHWNQRASYNWPCLNPAGMVGCPESLHFMLDSALRHPASLRLDIFISSMHAHRSSQAKLLLFELLVSGGYCSSGAKLCQVLNQWQDPAIGIMRLNCTRNSHVLFTQLCTKCAVQTQQASLKERFNPAQCQHSQDRPAGCNLPCK